MEENLQTLFKDLMQGLTDEEQAKFFSISTEYQIPVNHIILSPCIVCSKMWFLQEGAIRMFREVDGKDNTLHIFNTPRFFNDFVSVKDQKPATYSFQSLTPCSILEFDIVDFYSLLEYSINFERVGRKILELVLYQETTRLDDLIFLNATERYHKLMANNPSIFQMVPQKYIASYLNISPETLSRIRKG